MSSALDIFEQSLIEASRALQVAAGPGQPERVSSRSRRWRGPRLFVPGAIAAGLAAALLVVVALLPSGGGEPELGVGQASARAVLARAAQIAAATPASTAPSSHQFLYIKWIRSFTGSETIKHHRFALTNGQTEQDWEAPDGSGRQKLSAGFYRFLAPADRTAWIAAGRPTVKPSSIDGSYPRGAYFNQCGIAPRGTIGLSTNPDRLLRQVIDRYEGRHYNPGSTLNMAACILVTSAYPPLRAATYRMIEHLRGVEYLGAIRDGSGREGVALAVPDPKAGIKSIVIFDRVTAKPLEIEDVQKGTVVSAEILLASGVVNTDEALPNGGNVAFNRPPKIHVTEPAVPANPTQPQLTTLPELRGALSILRRPQGGIDRMPAWALTDEERQACSNCLNIPKLIPSATRLLTTIKVPAAMAKGDGGLHGPERVYLVLGNLTKSWRVKSSQKNQIPATTMNGWHQRGSELSGLHLSIVGFVRYKPHFEQPIDSALNLMETTMPAQTLTPEDVMIGQFGSVGVVPDGVTRVRWELINPGQAHPVPVYPRIQDNVATAPITRSHAKVGLGNEQYLASAVWYGAGGKVIASVNELPTLRRANNNW
jgi:hypothetical protein